jgi:hypothetical protein
LPAAACNAAQDIVNRDALLLGMLLHSRVASKDRAEQSIERICASTGLWRCLPLRGRAALLPAGKNRAKNSLK